MIEFITTTSIYFTLWGTVGAGVYIYLNLTRKPPKDKAECWMAILLSGPYVWGYAVFKLHNECMKDKGGNEEK
jgi:hypothetical protein